MPYGCPTSFRCCDTIRALVASWLGCFLASLSFVFAMHERKCEGFGEREGHSYTWCPPRGNCVMDWAPSCKVLNFEMGARPEKGNSNGALKWNRGGFQYYFAAHSYENHCQPNFCPVDQSDLWARQYIRGLWYKSQTNLIQMETVWRTPGFSEL